MHNTLDNDLCVNRTTSRVYRPFCVLHISPACTRAVPPTKAGKREGGGSIALLALQQESSSRCMRQTLFPLRRDGLRCSRLQLHVAVVRGPTRAASYAASSAANRNAAAACCTWPEKVMAIYLTFPSVFVQAQGLVQPASTFRASIKRSVESSAVSGQNCPWQHNFGIRVCGLDDTGSTGITKRYCIGRRNHASACPSLFASA